MDAGLKLALTFLDGRPLADSAIAELKPFCGVVVIVEVPELPLVTVIEVGDALMVKLAFGGMVTVRVKVVVRVMLPLTPLTVIVYVPMVAPGGTVKVRAEVPPLLAMDAGLKLTPRPDGPPVADKATAESKPFRKVAVIVDVPLLPCATETELGEAEREKLGDVEIPTSALIRLAPFGLPQPVTKS